MTHGILSLWSYKSPTYPSPAYDSFSNNSSVAWLIRFSAQKSYLRGTTLKTFLLNTVFVGRRYIFAFANICHRFDFRASCLFILSELLRLSFIIHQCSQSFYRYSIVEFGLLATQPCKATGSGRDMNTAFHYFPGSSFKVTIRFRTIASAELSRSKQKYPTRIPWNRTLSGGVAVLSTFCSPLKFGQGALRIIS